MNISTDETSFCQTATFTICNVNPSDLTDYGYFTPHRSDTYHLKPENAWYQILIPGTTRIKIYMGYGDELALCFYGFIDTTVVTIDSNSCTMNITCRDVGKILIDQTCNSVDNSVFNWQIVYPIKENVTPAYLEFADTDPSLEDIVKDICIRAGFIEADIECDATGIKLSDTLEGFLLFEDITWDACINKIKELTVFEFWINEDGKAQFRYPQSKVITVVDEAVCMFGTDPQLLTEFTASPASIVMVDQAHPEITYNLDVDFTFQPADNTVTRIEDSSLAEDTWVLISYTYVDWIFKNGVNIIQLPLTMSHDSVYAKIRVCGVGGTTGGIESTVQVAVDNTLWDGSKLLEHKVLVFTNENLLDEAACAVVGDRMAVDMRERYTKMNFNAIPLPMLQLRDIVQVIVYGLVSESYLVTGQTLTFTADGQKMTHSISCYHWIYAPI